MSLTNCEILRTHGPEGDALVVVADVPAATAAALADAVAHLRNALALGTLDAEGALAVRRAGELAERLAPGPAATMAVLRLEGDDLAVACDAAERYVAARDTESYQPPEERARIAALREVLAGLRDAQARIMLAGLNAADRAIA